MTGLKFGGQLDIVMHILLCLVEEMGQCLRKKRGLYRR